jgi:hypothetical protein
MGLEAIKLELIEWLTKLDDKDTINYLKVVKDSSSDKKDWWKNLSEDQKQGIIRGLQDIEAGRVIDHEEVKKRYGL